MDLVEFQEGERTFTCRAASSPATPGTDWWWVSVTGESQRYVEDCQVCCRPNRLSIYWDELESVYVAEGEAES